jgi:hypothetical protein
MSYFDSILPKNTGTEILGMANESAEASARDARSARIAELEAELAEIRKQKQSLDVEADMGRYKFQYDADPSTYTSVMQNRRNAEQTEKIRKATEDATKQSNAQNQWNSLSDKREAAEWALRAAESNFEEADRNGNVDAMNKAKDEIKRYTKAVRKLDNQMEALRDRFLKDLDIDAGAGAGVDLTGYEKKIGSAKELESINKEIVRLENLLNKDRQKNYPREDIKAVAKDADESIPNLRRIVENSNMSDTKKAELYRKLDELDTKANDWRGTGKQKPTVRLTPEDIEANARKAVFKEDGTMKNPAQLAEHGAAALRKWQKAYGWDLNAGIELADRKGKK